MTDTADTPSPSPSPSQSPSPRPPHAAALRSPSSSLSRPQLQQPPRRLGDALGLVRAVHPLDIPTPILRHDHPYDRSSNSSRVKPSPRHRPRASQNQHQAHGQCDTTAPPLLLSQILDAVPPVTGSPRHRRLQQQQTLQVRTQAEGSCVPIPLAASTATDTLPYLRTVASGTVDAHALSSSHALGTLRWPRPVPLANDLRLVPLHEIVQSFDDAVDASPLSTSNQAAITELFLTHWMAQFARDRALYKSVAVHAEVGFRELYGLTANLSFPNDLVTAFACCIFDDLAGHFGPYAEIVRVLCSELRLAIYKPSASVSTSTAPALPYFAIVKHQKRLVHRLRKQQQQRRERNQFLRHEIRQVHTTSLAFLARCRRSLALLFFREWHAIAVIDKRNTRKYVTYFSAWFSGSAKALVPRALLAWKHVRIESRIKALRVRFATLQEHILAQRLRLETLTRDRDVAQLETLAIRNDRGHAEDRIQRLQRKIQSANVFLKDTSGRALVVAREGLLRIEAVTFLPPLVLESLMRGFHSIGFLQQPTHREFMTTASADQDQHQEQDQEHDHADDDDEPHDDHEPLLHRCLLLVDKLTSSSGAQAQSEDRGQQEKELQEFSALFKAIQKCMGDPSAHVLFIGEHHHSSSDGTTVDMASEADQHEATDTDSFRASLVDSYERALRLVRGQDEHYACHTKLFATRMLEPHETSRIASRLPHAAAINRYPLQSQQHDQQQQRELPPAHDASSDLGVINGAKRFSTLAALASIVSAKSLPSSSTQALSHELPVTALEHLALMSVNDIRGSLGQSRAFLTVFIALVAREYGSLLFAPTDLAVFSRNAWMQDAMLQSAGIGIAIGGKRHAPITSTAAALEQKDNHATRNQSSLSSELESGVRHLIAAFNSWNRLSTQLVDAKLVQTRGVLHAVAMTTTTATESATVGDIGASTVALATIGETKHSAAATAAALLALRPRIHMHIEPLPNGALNSALKDREIEVGGTLTSSRGGGGSLSSPTSSTTTSSSSAIATPTPEPLDAATIQRLSLPDAKALTQTLHRLQSVVQASSRHFQEFTRMRQQLHALGMVQWQHASNLAAQLTTSPLSSSPIAVATPSSRKEAPEAVSDPRLHVFECITMDNDAMERLFSAEVHPHEELERVRTVLYTHRGLVRRLYTMRSRVADGHADTDSGDGAIVDHAATLDELWHYVKLLRLPRAVHVLPALRDDELLGTTGFEQRFSPDDLAELILQLANEQFSDPPTATTSNTVTGVRLATLSARVEWLVTKHLSLAAQNPSRLRRGMYHPDVQSALRDHAQTLRIIFRRYCVKDKEVNTLVPAAGMLAADLISSTASTGSTAPVKKATGKRRGGIGNGGHGHGHGHGYGHGGPSKYLRLVEWLEFLSDYRLLRGRFTIEDATTVFRNVQEAAGGRDDELEMTYSEFCEAVVAMAASFFPDPFRQSAARVHQFIRRYLPVSPDESHDHHA